MYEQEQKSRETAFKRIKSELIKKTNQWKAAAAKAAAKAEAKKTAREKKALQEQSAEQGPALIVSLLGLQISNDDQIVSHHDYNTR